MFSRLFVLPNKITLIAKSTRHWLGAFLFLGLLSACSTPQQTLELRTNPPDIKPRHELTPSAFFPQTEHHCGPAALATVVDYLGVNATPEQIVPMIYTPGLQGSLQIEVVAATRRFDLLPVKLDGRLASLLREVEAGNPVLVLQNLGLDSYPFWHYAVVVGYDLEEQSIILRSGKEKRLLRPFSNFERTWKRSDHWGLVIVDPHHIPRTADERSYLETVLELEQTGRIQSANAAYATASRQWPDSVLALLGLGNTSFTLQNFELSEQAFQNAIELSPNSHQLWNNLAYAQAKLGNQADALAAINRALELSPENPDYLHSLQELKQILGLAQD